MAKKVKRESEQENGDGVVVVQLATRVPKPIYKRLKLYAVTSESSISELVAEALTALLDKKGAGKKAA